MFKTKHDAKGRVERYKARLVAKGYSQREGIDFKEIFSPVSTKDSLCIIMAIVAHFNLQLHYTDVRTTFLRMFSCLNLLALRNFVRKTWFISSRNPLMV